MVGEWVRWDLHVEYDLHNDREAVRGRARFGAVALSRLGIWTPTLCCPRFFIVFSVHFLVIMAVLLLFPPPLHW